MVFYIGLERSDLQDKNIIYFLYSKTMLMGHGGGIGLYDLGFIVPSKGNIFIHDSYNYELVI
jgi:hypothetical protein